MSTDEQVSRLLGKRDELRTAVTPVSPKALSRDRLDPPAKPETQIDAVNSVEQVSTDISANRTVDFAGQAVAVGKLPDVRGYEILCELGRGGMGVVYQARHLQLNRLVAIKMIRFRGQSGADELKRFRTEAEAVARLQHANIVQIHEIGEHEDSPYITLEYCEGGSLANRLDGTPLPAKEAARLVETLARAMHKAHEAHIIHRDLKPGNILLTADGTPKITDFGLAKKLDDESAQTQSGAIIGTPSYMAPEQASGKTREIGRATDVYALGAILYELLTGRPPFKASSAMETMQQVLNHEPVAPRQLQPKTARDLETICMTCLHKEAARRYSDALALAEDLRRFQDGEPIRARPAGRVERACRWCRRNPAVAALLGMVAGLLITGTVVAWALALRSEENARKAMEALKQKEEQNDRAERLIYAGKLAMAQVEWRDGKVGNARTLLDSCRWDFRHWEHHYLNTTFNHAGQRTLLGHVGDVTSVAFSPDGLRLASGGWDQTVKIWDVITGQERLCLKGHTGQIRSVAFCPTGQLLASGCDGNDATDPQAPGEVKVWDARTGKETLSLKGHAGAVRSVAFHPQGSRLVSAGHDCILKVWEAHTGEELLSLEGHTGPITCVSFSPDGLRLASASKDRTVRVWDLGSGKAALSLKGHDEMASVAFSPDGTRLAGASWAKVEVWNARTGEAMFALEEKGGIAKMAFSPDGLDGVASMAFSPDSLYLASAVGIEVKLWDAWTKEQALTLKGHTAYVTSLAFSPDGCHLASASRDGVVKLWDARTGQKSPLVLEGHRGVIRSVAFSADGFRLASASDDRTVKIWDARTGQAIRSLKGHAGAVTGAVFSSDDRLATASADRLVKVWDASTGREMGSFKGHLGDITSITFSPDGTRVASGSRDRKVKVWDVRLGHELMTLDAHTGAVSSVVFSPDGRRLASSGSYDAVRVWDAQTGQEILSIKTHLRGAEQLAFSANGLRLAGANTDQTVRVWDALTGEEVLCLQGHTAIVASVAFSPDGDRIISGGHDGTVKVWDARTGQELLTLDASGGIATSVAFSPDGGLIAGTGRDSSINVWDGRHRQATFLLRGHTTAVSSLAFSVDGLRIISAARTPASSVEVKAWDARTGQEITPCLDQAPAGKNRAATSPDGRWLARAAGAVIQVCSNERSPADQSDNDRREELLRSRIWHERMIQVAQRQGNNFAAAFHRSRLAILSKASEIAK